MGKMMDHLSEEKKKPPLSMYCMANQQTLSISVFKVPNKGNK